VQGTLQATGLRPAFLEKLEDRGVHVDASTFAPKLGVRL
jgi:hypothetical protein